MKINKILISGLAMLSLSACNDFLDVDPATNNATPELVFSNESEIETALNGVYAKIVANNTFGNVLYSTFQLNSDVDFYANSNEAAAGNQPRRFDVRSDANNVESLWNALYAGVETANEFIYNLTNSNLYSETTEEKTIIDEEDNITTYDVSEVTSLTQMMGEAKVMRAMFYHELLWYFGDIPFTLQGTYETNNLLPEVTDRQMVSDALIEDLKHAAEYMYSDTTATVNAPERISKEAAYAMIARLALQAGGYSLNHDAGDQTNYKMTRPSDYSKYYEIAREYTKKIIDTKGHSLAKNYRDVFIDECNFIVTKGDDAIFEIPFAKQTSGYWGYAQGPSNGVDTSDPNYSNSAWGKTDGGVRTSHFYRFTFDKDDQRRDYVNGLWYYSNQGLPTLRMNDYTIHNNKWSKMWNTTGLGATSTYDTGINFAYIRYADVLLMFAEAENELYGPTADAQEALKTVRRRAFNGADYADKVDTYVADVATSKPDFLKAVLDERKWEFAGENMRWKDLVRNNMYSERLALTFFTYYAFAEAESGTSQYMEMVENYDNIEYSQYRGQDIFYAYVKNYNDPNFPNTGVYTMYILNPYEDISAPTDKPADRLKAEGYEVVTAKAITGLSSAETSTDWNQTTIAWANNDGTLKNQVLYSLYGYIRVDSRNSIVVIDNGTESRLNINHSNPESTLKSLPAVRYILPYPQEVVARSSGAYKNYYGY